MNSILFCKNKYAFGILAPIMMELKKLNYNFIWYVDKNIFDDFPYKTNRHTSYIKDLKKFDSHVIFVCGNAVPHYLKGVKTQVFHGFAGEKKGHFRIRNYFDLYLTQGPYFTNKFLKLKQKYKNFEVIQTGWSRVDRLFVQNTKLNKDKEDLLLKYKRSKIVLYAPTFSPRLTSAPFLKDELINLSKNSSYLIVIKFHPLMNKKIKDDYEQLVGKNNNIIMCKNNDITDLLKIADILISDTSSVIYEFSLLDKPVITFNNISRTKYWEDVKNYDNLNKLIESNLKEDKYSIKRNKLIELYHPYMDCSSSKRIINAVKSYITVNGVPNRRKLNLYRKYKIYRLFGF